MAGGRKPSAIFTFEKGVFLRMVQITRRWPYMPGEGELWMEVSGKDQEK
ncbi:hypothetical protein CHK_1365 [Christensenella hongkongensis]|uniref:Uncharacterized protein n=1 Tax=Christensenella hongkongensis TaxID=270498 RepID=A0A0M2NFM9_9FIRM|nr:hypothetical protein CHK_1365 [Christensenella hongkongensis]